MNKNKVLLIFLVAILGISISLLVIRRAQPQQSVPPPPSPQSTPPSTAIQVPVDPFAGEQGSATFVNPLTGAKISFRISDDPTKQNRGGITSDVFLNQKKIGE